MKARKKSINQYSITWDTERAKEQVKRYVEIADKLQKDPDKKQRKLSCECKRCFYVRTERIGGAAMTEWHCGICDKKSISGSTNCPTLCMECSQKHSLCAECGSDIELRVRRKWEGV